MSNRKKLVITKLPISVAAVKAENARRAALPEPEEGKAKLEALPVDRRSRRAMRRRTPVMNLMAQAAGHHHHEHGTADQREAHAEIVEMVDGDATSTA